MFPYFLLVAVIVIVLADGLAMYKAAFRAWTLMSLVLASAAFLAFFPAPVGYISQFLGIGRPVDVVLYCFALVLKRELFVSRVRDALAARRLAAIVRAVAIKNAQIISLPTHSPTKQL